MLHTGDQQLDSTAGWRVAFAAHAVTAVSFGSSYAFSALFPGLSAEFNATRGEVSLIFSISACVLYFLGAVAGPLADRWSTRAMVLFGIVALIAGYVVASQATSLPMLYLAYGCGVGVGLGFSYVPSVGAVQTWFSRKRAQASGVATAGIGLGTLLLPFIIGRLVPTLGWRDCFLVLALVVAVVGTPAALLVRRRTENPSRVVAWKTPPSFRAAWATPGFALFYMTVVLGSFCTFIPYVHIVPASRDLGLSTEAGTELVALIGIGNVFGRFVLAGFGDRLGPVRLLAALTALVAASFLLWVAATDFTMLAIFAVVFGAAYGGCVGLYPAVAARLFGVGHIGAMLGYLYTGVGIAALLGPSVAGYAFDYTGTYLVPLLASAAAAAVGAMLTLRLNELESHGG